MKIVIDSNVFVSSFFWKGNPRKIFDRVLDGYDELIITDEIISEIKYVMSKEKFDASTHEIEDYLKIIENNSQKITYDYKDNNISRDPDDDKILQCGIEGKVGFIISGDKDLLVLKEYSGIKILSPREYLEIVEKSPNVV